MNLTQKILDAHLLSGNLTPGEEISIRIDQTLTQDSGQDPQKCGIYRSQHTADRL